MSHFTVGVICPNSEESTDEYLNRILAPFDENLEVEPHNEDCWCINRLAQRAAAKTASALVGKRDELETLEMRQEWWETKESYLLYQPEYGKPDPDCDDCDGTGTVVSTYNQNRKWDYWIIGGRWNGDLPNGKNYMFCKDILANQVSCRPTLDPEDAEHDYFRTEYEEALAQYEATPEDLRDLYAPFALLTPDGEWHEKGDMGWWGIVTDDKGKPVWMQHVKSMYEQYADCTLVLIDCHI